MAGGIQLPNALQNKIIPYAGGVGSGSGVGPWISTTPYVFGDIVNRNGNFYQCIVTPPGTSTGEDPLSVHSSWRLESEHANMFEVTDPDTSVTACTFSALADTVITAAAHGRIDGETVKFANAGGLPDLPPEVVAGVAYYVRNVTALTYQLSATLTGAIINFSVDGDGTYTPYNESCSAAIVDGYDGALITTTGAVPAQIIHVPTSLTAGKRFGIGLKAGSTNNVTVNFGAGTVLLTPSQFQWFIWSGAAWVLGTGVDAKDIDYTPSGLLTAVTVQDAIDQLHSFGEQIHPYATVALAEGQSEASSGTKWIYVSDTDTIYHFEAVSTEVRDGLRVLNTVLGLTTRWIGYFGKYAKYGDGIRVVADLATAELVSLLSNGTPFLYVASLLTLYKYDATSGVARDGTYILNTADAGNTRWVGIFGKYHQNELDVRADVILDNSATPNTNSYKVILRANDGGTILTGSIYVVWGLPDPYLRICVPNSTGVETAVLDVHATKVVPTFDATTDLGSTGNRFKNLYLSGKIFDTPTEITASFEIDGAVKTVSTEYDLLTVTAGHTYMDGRVMVTNDNAADATIRIAHMLSGEAGAGAAKNWRVYDFQVPAGVTVPYTIPVLQAGDRIRVYSTVTDVTFAYNGNDFAQVLDTQISQVNLDVNTYLDVITVTSKNRRIKEVIINNYDSNDTVLTLYKASEADGNILVKFEFPANLPVTTKDFDIPELFLTSGQKLGAKAATANRINVIVYAE